jgi:Tol biopolymer transport system component
LPVAAAVKILAEVVDALAEAHRHGVIHRDIKPENVLLTGRHALVADFGVAKAVNEATGRHQLTTAGVALGTPAYMAPEQASAEPHLDQRVDVYAVGAMAYELLTGQPPFTGTSSAQVLAKHVTEAPLPIGRQRESIPPALEAVIMKCLAKRPADRWQSAEELLAQLEPIMTTPSGGVTPTGTRLVAGVKAQAPGSRRMLVIGGVAGVVLVVLAASLLRRGPEARIEFGPVRPLTNEPGLELQPALSPDGKVLGYVAGLVEQLRVYVRSVSGGTPIPLARDLAGEQLSPRWSPDGARVLFMGQGGIYAAPSLGGTPRLLVNRAAYATWSPDGKEIAYVQDAMLFARGVEGGTPRKLANGLVGDLHSLAWSPDGRFIAFVSVNASYWIGGANLGNLAPSILMLVPAAGGEPIKLSNRKFLHMSPAWMPDSRHLLFMSTQDGSRDVYSLALDGSGHPRGGPVRLTTGLDIGTFSVSGDGTLLSYSSFPNTSNIWAVPISPDRVFTEADARAITTGSQHIEGMAVSRDGQWLAFDSDRQGNPDIYRMPIAGGEPQQVTTDPSYDFIPSWSPDGKEIVFQSWRNETRDVFVIPATGGEDQMIAGGPAMDYYPDWSADGQTVAFYSDRTGRDELFLVSRDAQGKWGEARQLTHEGGRQPRWSPDGRGIVYLGPGCICVIAPDGGTPRRLLTQENADPNMRQPVFAVWSPDSRTVYFKAPYADGRSSFWAIPAEGGKPRLLAKFDNPAFASARQEFATDGKRLYFTADDRQSDIKVMEVRRP